QAIFFSNFITTLLLQNIIFHHNLQKQNTCILLRNIYMLLMNEEAEKWVINFIPHLEKFQEKRLKNRGRAEQQWGWWRRRKRRGRGREKGRW
ncbi:hypothetical protein Q6322_29320, partial [Klebsiella pneumoniae]|uniref:hypothetical protein n=1 Tax=Klebsiella pneumoniae TaxID=573 RepID=UPI00272F6852